MLKTENGKNSIKFCKNRIRFMKYGSIFSGKENSFMKNKHKFKKK